MIYVIATLKIQPGSLDAIRQAVAPCLVETRKEAGAISYDLFVDVTDENTLVFVERWASRAALEAHFSAPHLVAWRKQGGPYIVSRKIEIVHADKVEAL